MTLPIVRALGRCFQVVDIVTNRKFATLISSATGTLDHPALAPFFVANADLPQHWRDYFRRYDVIVSYLHDPAKAFEANVRDCGVSNFVCGPYRLESGSHAVEQLAHPLHQLGIAISDFAPRLELDEAELADVHAAFMLPFFALHPGSGSVRKRWPIESWIGFINYLLHAGKRVVVIGGEADAEEIGTLRELFDNRVVFAINWPLRRLGALLVNAKFIGHDSGISHLAAAVGARCLILFGLTDPKIWAPRNANARVLVAPDGDLRQLTVAQLCDALELEGDGSGSPDLPAQ